MAADFPLGVWSLKGGVNLRLFFKSNRYSEDIDIDVKTISVDSLKKKVIKILISPSFINNLKTFGIREIKIPDLTKAKQTDTTQRFKIYLLTSTGGDYFTKIEFSRRGFTGAPFVESIPASVLRQYGIMPFLVSHYPGYIAVIQKISAILSRQSIQPRDIFDLYLLSSQVKLSEFKNLFFTKRDFLKVSENIMSVDFYLFRDLVVEYMSDEDRKIYGSPVAWDDIKLKTISFIEELEKINE
jgi:predicted nucleotidyltransferase component of viral defense system